MSRVTNLRKKALQHKLDREVHKAKRAIQRRRNPKPVSKEGSILSPKRLAAKERTDAVRSQLSDG